PKYSRTIDIEANSSETSAIQSPQGRSRRKRMGAMFGRALRLCLLIALCLAAAAPAARAVNEKVWFSLDPGGVFYDPEQGFKDNFGIGLRAAGFINRHLGVEGLFTTSSPNIEAQSSDGTFTHFGGGLIVTPDRTAWSIPYLYGGL